MAADLFGVDTPPPATPVKLSADRKRTIRQLKMLQVGSHPLGANTFHLPLHPEAAPADDRDAPGRRCGDCRFRAGNTHHDKTHPKCYFNEGMRITHGAATDVRAWWPGCRDHDYAEAS